MKVYLTQTDTTVGLLSQDADRLYELKNRDVSKQFIRVVDSLETLKEFTRVPKVFRKEIRRASKTTYIYPNGAIRVSKDEAHNRFLSKYKWMYSTSANLSGGDIDIEWASGVADAIINPEYLHEAPSSKIIKIKKDRAKRLR